LGLWLFRLRRLNGRDFTWPLLMFANAAPESMMGRFRKIYIGQPLRIKTRQQLIETIKPVMRHHVRADTLEDEALDSVKSCGTISCWKL
jgi:hypothetical protein